MVSTTRASPPKRVVGGRDRRGERGPALGQQLALLPRELGDTGAERIHRHLVLAGAEFGQQRLHRHLARRGVAAHRDQRVGHAHELLVVEHQRIEATLLRRVVRGQRPGLLERVGEGRLARLEGLEEGFAAAGHEAAQAGLDVHHVEQHRVGLREHLVGVRVPADRVAQLAGVVQRHADQCVRQQQDADEGHRQPPLQCPVTIHRISPRKVGLRDSTESAPLHHGAQHARRGETWSADEQARP
jgi:hypothetical protein